MAIYRNDILITSLVDNALPTKEVIQVKNQTLDGSWHIQNIGVAATKVNVTAHLTSEQNDILEEMYVMGQEIKLVFDGKTHRGILEAKPSLERLKFSHYPLFKARFNILVTGVGL